MTFDLEKGREAIDSAINSLLCEGWDNEASTVRRLVAEIERLRGEMENYGDDYVCQMKSKDARIQELEDALIEQEARFQYYVQNENCESWPEARRRYPELNEKYLKIARQHLHAEGKIGPDARPKCDHAWQAAIEERGYQTCLKCGECRNIEDIPRTAPAWQITEDRVTAIDQGLRFLEWSNAKTGNVETKKRIAILKTMLEEASDEHGFER